MDSSELLERDREIARLRAAVDEGNAGNGRVVVIVGEAGVGKTRLLVAASTIARASGTRVLRARSSPMEESIPYGVVRQLYEDVLARSPHEAERWLAGAASRATQALGLSQPTHAPTPDVLSTMNHSLYWLTANLSEDGPLVLLVDDVHWADRPSLAFLEYLAYRIGELPVVVLAAARTAEGTAQEGLADLRAVTTSESLFPSPLSLDATATFLSRRRGGDVLRHIAEVCHDVTGGNPFLLDELVRAVALEGMDLDDVEAEAVRRLAPTALARSVNGRLDRLGENERAVAHGIAVLDGRADIQGAAGLAGVDLADAQRAVDRLVAAGVLADGRPLQFAHPLTRQVVYDGLPPALRAQLHDRAARQTFENGRFPERAAAHLLAADPSGDPWAVTVLRAAAAKALARGAPAQASVMLRRSLEERPDAETHRAVLAELGLAALHAGEPDGPAILRQALDVTAEPEARTALAKALAQALSLHGDLMSAVEVLQREADDLRAEQPDTALAVEATLVALGAATTLAQPLVARVEHLVPTLRGVTPNERALLASVALQRGLWAAEPASRILDLVDRATAVSGDDDAFLAGDFTIMLAATAYAALDRVDSAADLRGRLAALAKRTGSLSITMVVDLLSAWASLWQGNLRQALEFLDRLLELKELLGVVMLHEVSAALVTVHLETGDLDAARAVLTSAGLAEGEPAPLSNRMVLLVARARLRVRSGRMADALHDARAAAANPTPHGGLANGTWFSAALALHEAGGDADEVSAAAAREKQDADRLATATTRGAACLVLGRVGDPMEALTRFADAVRHLEDSPRQLELAHALVDYGAALRRANRRAEAREPLTRGMDLAQRSGATPLAQRAREELLATGLRPRSLVTSGLDALTAVERRVARLAAQDLSNVEIAQRLFVTRKTVETHLSHAYRKLGIASRKSLAEVFSDE